MLTQLTYEGLIDEMFGIRYNVSKLPAEKFQSSTSGDSNQDQNILSDHSSMKQVTLSSNEELYADLRDKNFNAVGPCLSKKAKAVAALFDERHSAKTVQDLKMFVEKMPQMQVRKASFFHHFSTTHD